jgi:hypothetical protein
MAIGKPFGASRIAPQHLVGQPITQAIPELVRMFPDVSRMTFVAYRPAPGLDARLARNLDPTSDIRETAEQIRERWGIPFWDAVLAIAMTRGEIPERYVELAILHDKSPEEHHLDMVQSEISAESVQSMLENLKDGLVLAVSSKVGLKNNGFAHIPMMDFRCEPSSKTAEIVKAALRAMGEEAGLLVNSGRSYHFYGRRLLSRDEWLRFLAMGILFSPIVDARYIAHRLADGACRLRIGPGPGKPSTPIVEEVFG